MTTTQIKALQAHIGAVPDGYWGPKSIAACQRHLKALMPLPSPWPNPSDVAMTRFYGKAGDETNLANLDVTGLGVKYDGKVVRSIRCHKLVSESLHRVLSEISKSPDAAILSQFAGCFNYRPMRGGSRPSKHAWGAAIDLAPNTNGLKTAWPVSATMPITIMEAFAREGWVGLGWLVGRDAMHFQATQP